MKYRNVWMYTEYPCECGEGHMVWTGWMWSSGDRLIPGREYLHVCTECDAQEVLTIKYPCRTKTTWAKARKILKRKPRVIRRAITPKITWRNDPNIPLPPRLEKLLTEPIRVHKRKEPKDDG